MRGSHRSVLTVGEALIALVAPTSQTLTDAERFLPCVGGSELNFAIGVARLGLTTTWIGRVGDDPFGARVQRTLDAEGVDTSQISTVSGGVTGLYLREQVTGGERQVIYYRDGSVGRSLSAECLPDRLSPTPAWVHLTGITAALGPGPRRLLDRVAEWTRRRSITLSFDPNYRRALWAREVAKPELTRLALAADVVLLSELDAEVLVGSADPDVALPRLREMGIGQAVLRRAGRGVSAAGPAGIVEVPATSPRAVVDTVGAGDGFNAGFVAARLQGAPLRAALELGAHVGARAVENVGDHCFPHRAELPRELRDYLPE
jgi:2-dehydro-3-deoxygluconokinase